MRYGMHLPLKGNFGEYFSAVRSEGFGEEAKRRILLGTFARMAGYRDAYYLRALKLRSLLIKEFKRTFAKFDAVANPAMPSIAPKFSDISKMTPLQHYCADILVGPANLGGFPHISVNAGFSHSMPVGIMFTADHFMEGKVIQLGSASEAAAK
jgi:aspartyl-tRNA(Asn)/glutamyl-tRNA(Gln) amidotransferase subunit A